MIKYKYVKCNPLSDYLFDSNCKAPRSCTVYKLLHRLRDGEGSARWCTSGAIAFMCTSVALKLHWLSVAYHVKYKPSHDAHRIPPYIIDITYSFQHRLSLGVSGFDQTNPGFRRTPACGLSLEVTLFPSPPLRCGMVFQTTYEGLRM